MIKSNIKDLSGSNDLTGQSGQSLTEFRAAAYKLLADCYQSPDEGTPDRFQELNLIIAELYQDVSGIEQELTEDIEELKKDHAKLFLGPFSLLAPPYGSVYIENSDHLIGETTINTEQWYAMEGMDVAIKEVPDHIRIELEFMYYLIYQEQQLEANKKTEASEAYRDKQHAFLNQHLGRWVSKFADRVRGNTQTNFYKNLAELTDKFITKDKLYLLRESQSA